MLIGGKIQVSENVDKMKYFRYNLNYKQEDLLFILFHHN